MRPIPLTLLTRSKLRLTSGSVQRTVIICSSTFLTSFSQWWIADSFRVRASGVSYLPMALLRLIKAVRWRIYWRRSVRRYCNFIIASEGFSYNRSLSRWLCAYSAIRPASTASFFPLAIPMECLISRGEFRLSANPFLSANAIRGFVYTPVCSAQIIISEGLTPRRFSQVIISPSPFCVLSKWRKSSFLSFAG